MTYADGALVKLLRQGWRGETATDLMREAADRIENLRERVSCVEEIRRDVYRPLQEALRREAALGPSVKDRTNRSEPQHDASCAEWCNHCEVCGVGILYGSRCPEHPNRTIGSQE